MPHPTSWSTNCTTKSATAPTRCSCDRVGQHGVRVGATERRTHRDGRPTCLSERFTICNSSTTCRPSMTRSSISWSSTTWCLTPDRCLHLLEACLTGVRHALEAPDLCLHLLHHTSTTCRLSLRRSTMRLRRTTTTCRSSWKTSTCSGGGGAICSSSSRRLRTHRPCRRGPRPHKLDVQLVDVDATRDVEIKPRQLARRLLCRHNPRSGCLHLKCDRLKLVQPRSGCLHLKCCPILLRHDLVSDGDA